MPPQWRSACPVRQPRSRPRARQPSGCSCEATALGSVEDNVRRVDGGWTLSGTGHLEPPLDLTTKRRLEMRYDANWQPKELTLDAATRGATIPCTPTSRTARPRAISIRAGVVTHKTDPVSAGHAGSAEPVLRELRGAGVAAGVGAGSAAVSRRTSRRRPKSRSSRTQRSSSASRQPSGSSMSDLRADVSEPRLAARRDGLDRRSGPPGSLRGAAQSLLMVREDFASVSSRAQVMSRAGDQGVSIAVDRLQPRWHAQPAVGQGDDGCEGTISGDRPDRRIGADGPRRNRRRHPIFAQIANALADAGYYVLRYDKRGVG